MAVEPLTVSRGSTEPKAVFDAVNGRLALGLDPSRTKPEYAEAICRAAGVAWDDSCDSRHTASGGGSTVTIVGLERVLTATRLLVERSRSSVPSHGLLPPTTPLEDEVRRILEVLDEELPTHVDGRQAVRELRAADYNWRQIEWPGFYFEFVGRKALRRSLGGDIGPRFGNTEFDYQLIRVFDIKVHSEGSSSLWLNDAEAVETAVLRTGGIGFIIVHGEAEADEDGAFRQWHDQQKGERTRYSVEREARGASPRRRKTAFQRTGLEVIHLTGIDSMRDAVQEGWLSLREQGRQSSGGTRRPKYQLVLSRVPQGLRQRP